MSRISGIPRTEVLSLWEQVKENHRKLNACPRHRFEGKEVRIGQKMTCLECGGEMDLSRIGQYIDGYRAAGGDSDDVWPGYSRTGKI